ncbi:tRNA 2-thiouridine(34) synthase MnmA [Candidatus Uhrbacteria bacterium]|nr:tRNA 2-thiouridine(34) synthase MnmA [Candidatus Uhrbacteria bacterium]
MSPPRNKPAVLVGMSGGVDSSVTAAILKRRGFNVVGGFIKNWSDSKDLWTGECNWRGERRDAIRVAAQLGIPVLTFDFETEYRRRVLKDFFSCYEAGGTPNPDVLCNEMIKFGLFFEAAKDLRMDFVATGHYARIRRDPDGVAHLRRGSDPEKDQSYFLYRVPQDALKQTLFPIGHLRKAAVRSLAKQWKLPVAAKPDSQGICFVGKLDLAEFLRKKIPSRPGRIVNPDGDPLGRHDGLDQYTIGQRAGIRVSRGGKAWYVAGKDLKRNELLVVPSDDHPLLYRTSAVLHDLRWTRGAAPTMPLRGDVQVRYRQPPVRAVLTPGTKKGTVHVEFDAPVKAVAAGQSAVIYRGKECLGGGVIG